MKFKYKTILGFYVLILIFAFFRISEGVTIKYTYDNLNRLTKVVYGDGTTEEFTYDPAGNRLSHLIEVSDISPPTGSISINSGAIYSNSTSVTLSISASDPSGVSQMCISNTTSCSSWESYTTSKPWTLTPEDGTKNVYIWFKDGVGNANPSPYSAYIILDTNAPANGTLSATAGNAQVSLSWSGFSDSGGSGLKSTNTYKVVRNTEIIRTINAQVALKFILEVGIQQQILA
ncbi:MAG: RHS repeat domain-containing protein [Thermodesulfovibrionales bacterium]